MNKILMFLTCSTMTLQFIHSSNWQDYWLESLALIEEKKYLTAEIAIDTAIEEMEGYSEKQHSYIYIDQAKIKTILGKNEKALESLNIALSDTTLTNAEKINAILNRWIVYARLDMTKECNMDLQTFGKIYPNMPVTERLKDKIIIRNAPTRCPCYKKLMTCYYIHSGICDSKNDIQMNQNGVCVVQKACDCGCEDCEKRMNRITICDACGATLQPIQKDISSCKGWCDRAAVAGGTFCGQAFKNPFCQAACAVAVYELQQGCYWCCDGNGFYKRCIKPFEDILSVMGNGCEPYVD